MENARLLCCEACDRLSSWRAEGWTAFLQDTDGGESVSVFCPECAAKNFGWLSRRWSAPNRSLDLLWD